MTQPSTTPPTSVDDAIACVRESCRPLPPERVPLANASGRVLCEDVVAPEDQPPFDRSSVDGYAVRLDDPRTHFRVIDLLRAGEWKQLDLQPGEAVAIATGGALPAPDLQVVMKEDVTVQGDQMWIVHRDTDRNIRFRGEDAAVGSVLVSKGTRLLPGSLALLASVGSCEPLVTRLPRTLHLATGNEIVAPNTQPAHGQIRDSNSTLVRAFLNAFCIEPAQSRVAEDQAKCTALIRDHERAGEMDLLLISGGASVGQHDFTRTMLEDLGYTIHISRTTTRPGKPLIFATRGNSVAFGLPGNPLAHFVCLNLYVRAALLAFSGQTAAPIFAQGQLLTEFHLRA